MTHIPETANGWLVWVLREEVLLCMWGIGTCYRQTSIDQCIQLRLRCSSGKGRRHQCHQLPNTL